MDMTPGRAAYEKFIELLPGTTGINVWSNLDEIARSLWEEVAKAAIEERKHEDTCSICRTGKVSGDSDAADGSAPQTIGHHRAQAARERGILRHDLEDDMPFGREHYVPFKD